jgi:hypothetical protein
MVWWRRSAARSEKTLWQPASTASRAERNATSIGRVAIAVSGNGSQFGVRLGAEFSRGYHGQGPRLARAKKEPRNLYEVKTLINHVRDPIVSALCPLCSRNAAEKIMAIRVAR